MKMLPDGLGHFSDVNSMGHKSSHPVENSTCRLLECQAPPSRQSRVPKIP